MTGALRQVIEVAEANGWQVKSAPVGSIAMKRAVDRTTEHHVLAFFTWGGLKFDFALIYPNDVEEVRTQVLDDLLADLKQYGARP